MIVWAAVVALVLGGLTYFLSEPSMLLLNLAELVGVLCLFALVCAAEAFN
ncbi:hypothetical protein [Microvirga pudoricolor]|nr:hypothetical protein [Microvirga pudoricolor]MBM6592395.1 hypothetical protein [Microvirga pudoricolor]